MTCPRCGHETECPWWVSDYIRKEVINEEVKEEYLEKDGVKFTIHTLKRVVEEKRKYSSTTLETIKPIVKKVILPDLPPEDKEEIGLWLGEKGIEVD